MLLRLGIILTACEHKSRHTCEHKSRHTWYLLRNVEFSAQILYERFWLYEQQKTLKYCWPPPPAPLRLISSSENRCPSDVICQMVQPWECSHTQHKLTDGILFITWTADVGGKNEYGRFCVWGTYPTHARRLASLHWMNHRNQRFHISLSKTC